MKAMEKDMGKEKQKENVSEQEMMEEIFHPDFVGKKTKGKKRFRGMLGHWFGLLLVIIISIVIFYCLSNLSYICLLYTSDAADE